MIRIMSNIAGILLSLVALGAVGDAEQPGSTSESGRKIVVVVSRDNPVQTVSKGELRRIFLRKKTQWPGGTGITVYERPASSRIRKEFSQRVLGKKPGELKEYWMNLMLTRGLKPPKVLRSAKLVTRHLQRVKGGIAYVYEDEIGKAMRAVEIKEAGGR